MQICTLKNYFCLFLNLKLLLIFAFLVWKCHLKQFQELSVELNVPLKLIHQLK